MSGDGYGGVEVVREGGGKSSPRTADRQLQTNRELARNEDKRATERERDRFL